MCVLTPTLRLRGSLSSLLFLGGWGVLSVCPSRRCLRHWCESYGSHISRGASSGVHFRSLTPPLCLVVPFSPLRSWAPDPVGNPDPFPDYTLPRPICPPSLHTCSGVEGGMEPTKEVYDVRSPVALLLPLRQQNVLHPGDPLSSPTTHPSPGHVNFASLPFVLGSRI